MTDTTALRKSGHWGRKDIWTFKEAVDLSLNVEPGWQPPTVSHSRSKQLAHDRKRRRELVDAANDAGRLRDSNSPNFTTFVRPRTFILWCDLQELDFPLPIREAVQKFQPPNEAKTETARSPKSQDIHHRVRSSLFRMIYAMAANGRESFTEKDIPAKIKEVIEWSSCAGFEPAIDDQTARKYLGEAIAHVDGKSMRSAK